MSKLTAMELLEAKTKIEYNYGDLGDGVTYNATVVEVDERDSKFGGTYYKIVFEVSDGNHAPSHASKLVTYMHKNGAIDKGYVEFAKLFFDFSNEKTIVDLNRIIDKKCKIKTKKAQSKDGRIYYQADEVIQVSEERLISGDDFPGAN